MLIYIKPLLFFAILVITAESVTGLNPTYDNPDILYPDKIQDEFKTKCFVDQDINVFSSLDCFYTGPPWHHPLYRPISVPPADTITTIFLLYTRKHRKKYFNFYPYRPNSVSRGVSQQLLNSGLEVSDKIKPPNIKVLIHDYSKTFRELLELKDRLLDEEACNVFIIDWSKDALPPYYQAVANMRVTALRTWYMLRGLLVLSPFHIENVHLIGKGVGAHIAGYVGKLMKKQGNIGRITGLDPAGPYFHNVSDEVRLKANDATFVDVIHTNAGKNIYEGEGLIEPVGHLDFYPNGGNIMPWCGGNQHKNQTEPSRVKIGNKCSHDAALQYFISSFKLCKYEATACSSYSEFKDGKCIKGAKIWMGFLATKPEGPPAKYYLDTSKNKPYCEK